MSPLHHILQKTRGLRKSIRRLVRKHAVAFILDFIVLFGTASWWTTPFKWFRFYHFILIVLLLRWERFDRFPLVRLFFALLSILFIDIVIFSFFPLFCVSHAIFGFSLASIPIFFYLIVKFRGFSIRSVAYSFIPAVILSYAIVGRANQPCTLEECDAVRSQPEIEVLVDIGAAAKAGIATFSCTSSGQEGFHRRVPDTHTH